MEILANSSIEGRINYQVKQAISSLDEIFVSNNIILPNIVISYNQGTKFPFVSNFLSKQPKRFRFLRDQSEILVE